MPVISNENLKKSILKLKDIDNISIGSIKSENRLKKNAYKKPKKSKPVSAKK